MRTAVLVPYRSDSGRRDELWKYTEEWLYYNHYSWPIYLGESPEGPFNRGAAINDAARQAGGFDVAVVHDADNISDPMLLERAVQLAYEDRDCVFPFSKYLYLDEPSSNRLIYDDNWFVAPGTDSWSILPRHLSGVQAISHAAYDAVGGFVELEGWGHEDIIMGTLLKTFTAGVRHLEGVAYHLYHGDTSPERKVCGEINRQILADVLSLAPVPDQLRMYLQEGGHRIP